MAYGTEFIFEIFDMIKFILVWFWWVILLGFIFGFKIKWKSYPIDVVIIEKRDNNLVKSNDRAGRFRDPYTGSIKYKLLKAGDSILVPNYDHVLHNVANNTTIFDKFINLLRGNAGTIFLFRYGSKQYKPLKIKATGKTELEEIKDKNGNSIFINRYIFLDPRTKLQSINFEVVDWDNMNQMVAEWKETSERRKKKSEFWKQIVIPALMIGGTILLCIIMIKFGYDYAMNVKGSAPPQQSNQNNNIPIINDIIPG